MWYCFDITDPFTWLFALPVVVGLLAVGVFLGLALSERLGK